jgi:hypothetical protein
VPDGGECPRSSLVHLDSRPDARQLVGPGFGSLDLLAELLGFRIVRARQPVFEPLKA